MKKKWLLGLGASVLSISLVTGCGDMDNENQDPVNDAPVNEENNDMNDFDNDDNLNDDNEDDMFNDEDDNDMNEDNDLGDDNNDMN